MVDQAAEGRGQLIQGRIRQRIGVHPRQNRFAALQHFALQVERQAVALTFLPLPVAAPQIRFVNEPAMQGALWNLEKLAHAREITIVLVYFV